MKSLIFFVLISISHLSFCLETDQFIATNANLSDASEVMNSYFKGAMNKALKESNQKNHSCQIAALNIMLTATGKFSISKASTFASKTPLIERFPNDQIKERQYTDMSFYEHAWLPLQVVTLARTININGIYMGTDKFGHFTHMGMNYYKTYLKFKEQGNQEDEAIKKAILKGFGSEYGILGYGIGGVMSYGDLEANYQGFMFLLDMCRGENPILIKDHNVWIENPLHKFNVKDYFNPKMDESFNISFWRKPLYKKIKAKLHKEYCEVQNEKSYQDRVSFYNSIAKNNLNDQLMRDYILSQNKYSRKLEDLSTSCLN